MATGESIPQEKFKVLHAMLRPLKSDIFENKQIVLYTGAGVNYSKGVKVLWEDVMEYLFKKALLYIARENDMTHDQLLELFDLFEIASSERSDLEVGTPSYLRLKRQVIYEYSPQIKASIVKAILKQQYIPVLQDFLYENCNKESLREAFCQYLDPQSSNDTSEPQRRFHTLYVIARMILLNPNIKAVVTYNYDNFISTSVNILQGRLDKFFSEEECTFIKGRFNGQPLDIKDVYGQFHHSTLKSNTLFVYHVHGFIPPPSECGYVNHNNIVLSLDEYCEHIREINTWDNGTHIHLLSHYTGIFMGMSLSDITMQRMLHYASKNGNDDNLYYLNAYNSQSKEEESPNCVAASENLFRIKTDFYKACGLTPIISKWGFEILYDAIDKINIEYANKLIKEYEETKH